MRAGQAGDEKFATKQVASGPTPLRAKLREIFGPKKVDELSERAEKLALEVSNAERFKAALASRQSGIAPDSEQAVAQMAAGSLAASASPFGPTIGPAGAFGVGRKAIPAMSAPEKFANQEVRHIMQMSGKGDILTMHSLLDYPSLSLGGGVALGV